MADDENGPTSAAASPPRDLIPFRTAVRAWYVERLRGNQTLSSALTAITAAVVGVIANLALYFTTHTLFATSDLWSAGPLRFDVPDLATIQPAALGIAVVAALLLFVVRWSVLRTLGVCALALGLAGLL